MPDEQNDDREAARPGGLAVVVVNYGSHRLIDRNFGGLREGVDDLRIVVVDSRSGDDEAAALRAVCARRGWDVVLLPDNPGFGAAANAGIRHATSRGASVVALVNPDVVLDAPGLQTLRERVEAQPSVLVSPVLVDEDGAVLFDGSRLDLHTGDIRRLGSTRPWRQVRRRPTTGSDAQRGLVPWLPGTCLVAHRDLLARTGGLDEDYFMYWEDLDLSYRCLRNGFGLAVCTDVTVVHDAGATQGATLGRAKSALYYRYNCRNRLLFAALRLDRRQVGAWLLRTPSASRQILLRGGRRQLVRSPGLLIAALDGTMRGVLLALWSLLPGSRVSRRKAPDVVAALGASPGSRSCAAEAG